MKYLFLILISIKAYAIDFSQFRSVPNSSSIQTFKLTENKFLYDKRSNYFDENKKLSLGIYSITPSQDIYKKLDAVYKKIVMADEILRKKGTRFNELNENFGHSSIFIIDNFKIGPDSKLYPDLKKLFVELLALEWKLGEGVVLSGDLKSYSIIKKGKTVETKNFVMKFHCEKSEAPTVCAFKDFGILFVGRK